MVQVMLLQRVCRGVVLGGMLPEALAEILLVQIVFSHSFISPKGVSEATSVRLLRISVESRRVEQRLL